MGLCLDPDEMGTKLFSMEIRRESVCIHDDTATSIACLSPEDRAEADRCGVIGKSDHIFCYAEGNIEISKEFLLEVLTYFDDPENRKEVFASYENRGNRLRPPTKRIAISQRKL